MHPFQVIRSGHWKMRLSVALAMGSIFAACDSSSPATAPAAATWNKSDFGIPWKDSLPYGTFEDARDGQVYRSIAIGTQVWMAENLNFSGAGACYEDLADTCAKYGRLYTWAEAMGTGRVNDSTILAQALPARGICPSGWHLPSDTEWTTFLNKAGGAGGYQSAGPQVKSTRGWINNGWDTYGFRALPAGVIQTDGSFEYLGTYGFFWSSSEDGARSAYFRYVDMSLAEVIRRSVPKQRGISVRCIRN